MKLLRLLKKWVSAIPAWIWISGIYLASHLANLTLLPVFADESIYIRWAQLIQDDAGRYAFFSMMDGKPPLFIWLLAVVLRPHVDPLWAGRALSVGIGLVMVFVMRKLLQELTRDKTALFLVTGITMFTPFWFFYHRVALMDGLLALLLAIVFLATLKLSKRIMGKNKLTTTSLPLPIIGVTTIGLSYGGALWTKTPALFCIPMIAFVPLFVWLMSKDKKIELLLKSVLLVGVGGAIGMMIFLILRLSPLFGSLFSRSTDFTFTLNNILSGEWQYIIQKSLPRNLEWILYYFSVELIVLACLGFLNRKTRPTSIFLLIMALGFFAPLTLFGKVLWPRYFLPCVIFLTLASGIGASVAMRQKLGKVLLAILFFTLTLRTAYFVSTSHKNPADLPFVYEDKLQYITEWSAGYGNQEVREYILRRIPQLPQDGSKKIVVLTEGSFGTLPDGLLMFFHDPVSARYVEIHGIGVAVLKIPAQYLERSRRDEVYYMLNSRRFGLANPSILEKVFEIPRPGGNNLLFYRIKLKP